MQNLSKVMSEYKKMDGAARRLATEKDFAARGWKTDVPAAEEALKAARSAFCDAAAKLTEEIKESEGHASARTISAADICKALLQVEERLNIPKKAMEGISADIDIHAQRMPRAYKYPAISTHFTAEVKNGSWRVTDIYRGRVNAPSEMVIISHTEDSKKAVLAAATRFEF